MRQSISEKLWRSLTSLDLWCHVRNGNTMQRLILIVLTRAGLARIIPSNRKTYWLKSYPRSMQKEPEVYPIGIFQDSLDFIGYGNR